MIFKREGRGESMRDIETNLSYIIYMEQKRKEKNSEYRQNRSMLQQFHIASTTRNLQVDCTFVSILLQGFWRPGRKVSSSIPHTPMNFTTGCELVAFKLNTKKRQIYLKLSPFLLYFATTTYVLLYQIFSILQLFLWHFALSRRKITCHGTNADRIQSEGRQTMALSFLPYFHRLSEAQFLWKLPARPSADDEISSTAAHPGASPSWSCISQQCFSASPTHFHFPQSHCPGLPFQVKHQNVRQKYK